MEKERKRKRSARDTKSAATSGAFASVGQAVTQAAGAVKAAAVQAVEAVQAVVAPPEPPKPEPKVEKVKRPRFVYTPPAEKRPAPVKADPPPQSKSTVGRMLVKHLKPAPDAPTALDPVGGKRLP